jgi:hypothetical protein
MKTHGAEPSEPLSIDEIEVTYSGQWVAVSLTAVGEHDTPLAGRVVAHGSRTHVWKALAQIVQPGEIPDLPYYVFAAGSLVIPTEPSDVATAQSLAHEPAQ